MYKGLRSLGCCLAGCGPKMHALLCARWGCDLGFRVWAEELEAYQRRPPSSVSLRGRILHLGDEFLNCWYILGGATSNYF